MGLFLRGGLVLLLVLCARISAGAADIVHYGIASHPDSILPIIGGDEYKAWYKAEGLDVEFTRLAWRDVPAAIATGKLDVAVGSLAEVVSNHAKYPDLVFWYGVATLDNGFALMIRPDEGIKTVDQLMQKFKDRKLAVIAAAEQLKGRSIVTTMDSELGMALSSVARDAGLHLSKDETSDIKVIDLRPDPGLQIFLNHQGDAYLGPLVQRLQAEKSGMVEMLSGADFGAAPIIGFLTTRQYADTHKTEMLKLLKVWFRTVNYTQQHKDDIGAIVSEQMKKGHAGQFTVEDFKRSWQNFEQYPLTARDAAARILDPNGANYWKTRQQECSAYFCSVADMSPQEDDSNKAFTMADTQSAYMAKYGDLKQ